MFGMKDIGKLMANFGDIKQKIGEMETELRNLNIMGSDDEHHVRVELNGKFELQGITLDDSAMELSKIDLEVAMKQATGRALEKVTELAKEKLKEATGGIDIPGLNL